MNNAAETSQPTKDERYDLFLCYNSKDRDEVLKIKEMLREREVKSFLDCHDLAPGQPWRPALEQQIPNFRAAAVFLGKHGYGRTQEGESDLLIDRAELEKTQGRLFPVVPVILPDGPEKAEGFLSRYTWIDLRAGVENEAEINRLVAAISGATPPEQTSVNPLIEYHQKCINDWSESDYALDTRFVNLTLLLAKDEQEFLTKQPEELRFTDLREVLDKTQKYPALILLGDPGAGKSTLLRHFQLTHSQDQLNNGIDKNGNDKISFFISLTEYRGEKKPAEWLATKWAQRSSGLPNLNHYLKHGRVLLLLDALNEMQTPVHSTNEEMLGWWRDFTHQAAEQNNRIVFSCRKLDYGFVDLGRETRPVPQLNVLPMQPEQVRLFLEKYAPAYQQRVWEELEKSPPLFDLYSTPIYLKMLCEIVTETHEVPSGRASLFTAFARKALMKELQKNPLLREQELLLDKLDCGMITRREWGAAFDLPEHGLLIRKLSELAFKMQMKRKPTESDDSEGKNLRVSITYDEACSLLSDHASQAIIEAGVALKFLDQQGTNIKFHHQLLQEYFAARRLAKEPNPTLVHTEWKIGKVRPSLQEKVATLSSNSPLPPLPQTGWEETVLTAAPMADHPADFIRALMPHNLPLAARCAASPEVVIDPALKHEIQQGLLSRIEAKPSDWRTKFQLFLKRSLELQTDLRARISAGEALGVLGDPRFILQQGEYGAYLMPPMVPIVGGTYPIGDNDSGYDFERPTHTVKLAPFEIGQFPVTNAEYAKFMAAEGYENEQWWDTPEALQWLREGGAEGQKQSWRLARETILSWPDGHIETMVEENSITPKQAEDWTTIRNWSEEEFEAWLSGEFSADEVYRQPRFWGDTSFNNPAQPVVGITWFEARAYCNWLSANTGQTFRLPTEVEFEAAARGKKGRAFPYGKQFDAVRCNTFESHIRRTTPVGIFDNATPEGAFDLSGNAYTWTLSIYDEQQFLYPYRSDDGREDIRSTGIPRVLRGGSWFFSFDFARAVSRYIFIHPSDRNYFIGFRVSCAGRPPS